MTTIESMRNTYKAMLRKWAVYVDSRELNAHIRACVGEGKKPNAYIQALKGHTCRCGYCSGSGYTKRYVDPRNLVHNHRRCYKCQGKGKLTFRDACREYAYRNGSE